MAEIAFAIYLAVALLCITLMQIGKANWLTTILIVLSWPLAILWIIFSKFH
jgi:hypothetical protein